MIENPGFADFSTLISTSTLIGDNYFVGYGDSLPYTGSLVFDEQLLLVGFTTAGSELSDGERFVSNFTVQYSATNTTEQYNYVYKVVVHCMD